MLYQILLLHDILKEFCKVKDYLQLSGCDVTEGLMEGISDYKEKILCMDAIVFYFENPERYFTICQKIRKLTQIPLIIVSGNNDEWVKIKMFQSGVDDYLVEPVLQGEVIARMQAHIVRYQSLTRPLGYIQAGNLEINAFSRQVKLRGKEIFFRAKEFDVLLYLAQKGNKVVSKQELYEQIWMDDLGGGYYNSVAVHIKRIRMKIEDNPDSPKIIETVWGIGYRFRL